MKATVPTLGGPFVVPGKPRLDTDGKPLPLEPIVGLQAPWERIRGAAGLDPRDKKTGAYLDEENNPGWHDLRRTFASVGADLGLKGFVGESLGHTEATVTDIYTRSAAEGKRRRRKPDHSFDHRQTGFFARRVEVLKCLQGEDLR